MNDNLLVAIIGGIAVIITSFITAYITSNLSNKREEKKWKKEFSLKFAEILTDNPEKAIQLEKQFAIGILLIIENEYSRFRKYIMPNNRVQIGRLSTSDIILDNENISNEHCAIYSNDKKVYLEDLYSTNGIYLNGHLIKDKVELKDNDEIKIVDTIIKFKKL